MRLSECLNSSDIDTLRNIAERHGFDCHRSSKNSLMQTIMAHFRNRTFIRETLAGLDSRAYRETLQQLTLDRRKSFSREDLAAIIKRATGDASDQHQRLVSQLLRDGWLYRLGSQGGKSAYYLPEDLLQTMKEYITEELQKRVEQIESPPVVYRDDQLAIVRDAMQLIAFINNHDVKITQDGVIYKRQLLLLLDSMEIREDLLNTGWRFGYGRRFHDYPDRFALIYDYCYGRGLIEELEEGLLALTDKVEPWLRQPDKQKLYDMVKFWRLLYRRPIPRLALAVSTIASATRNRWTTKESVNQLISPYVNCYYYDSQQQVMEMRIYQMLVYLGLLWFGKLPDGRDVMRLSDLGREILLEELPADEPEPVLADSAPLIVQPNFDVLLPASEAGKLAWELSQFSELVRADMMRIYRLTKASVRRGLQNGWSTDRILGFLDRHSGNLLPRNVKRMIERWSEETVPGL
ncbi:helicase-associated domain-containing protein [Effusibacillus pohliae]|uniref:helicase-associated domain-containing protein n=1 Tax=Effusibacillus pohliae TaxID=232270 RepID=UPI00035C63DE|nr:helicase-associated domain-containing protein [Effusibacillus pohliae]